MKLPISLAAMLAFIVVLTMGASSSAAPGDNAVVHWSDIASSSIAAGRPPGSSSVLAGIVHGAIYDSVAAVEGDLEPFVTDVADAPDASVEAAVATAACRVLEVRVPGQAGVFGPLCTDYVDDIPDSAAKDAGIAAGLAAANGMIAFRDGDGFGAPSPYTPPATHIPGVFEPIAQGVVTPESDPPSATPAPVDKMLATVRPFTYDTPSDYRPDPPYALTSKKYAADVAELKDVGRLNSTTRTDAQTQTVRFFSDQTFVQYSRALRRLANEQSLDVRESARLLGYAWVAIGDTMIACWDAKFAYNFWRPNHAIQRAESDGNPETGPNDTTWLPLLTGNHPEYPSGHSCFTAALTEVLHRYFRTKEVPLTVTSTTLHNGQLMPSRTYAHTKDLVADVQNARVWGGLHYRTTVVETAKHFPRIARDVGKRYFLTGLESD